MENSPSMHLRSGLTLVELVVVLAILAIVAGTALTATGSLVDETKYQTTQSELRSLESALLGSFDAGAHGAEGSIAFVADVGRPPRVASADADRALTELWERPADVAPFAIQAAPGDPDVRLPAGWRGPYLRLGFGAPRLVDGWGRPYACLAADDTPAPLGATVAKIRTLGADGVAGGAGFDADATLVLASTLPVVLDARYAGDVPVRVRSAAVAEEFIVVRIFGARDGALVTLFESEPAKSNGDDVLHTFVDVPVGPRAVRAYRTLQSNLPSTPEEAFTGAFARSAVRAVTVVQGGVAEIEIELP
jgi:prepilin-type N-terminal cleavage/methylation domain-containing protein